MRNGFIPLFVEVGTTVEEKKIFKFYHLAFQEHLAAQYVFSTVKKPLQTCSCLYDINYQLVNISDKKNEL